MCLATQLNWTIELSCVSIDLRIRLYAHLSVTCLTDTHYLTEALWRIETFSFGMRRAMLHVTHYCSGQNFRTRTIRKTCHQRTNLRIARTHLYCRDFVGLPPTDKLFDLFIQWSSVLSRRTGTSTENQQKLVTYSFSIVRHDAWMIAVSMQLTNTSKRSNDFDAFLQCADASV